MTEIKKLIISAGMAGASVLILFGLSVGVLLTFGITIVVTIITYFLVPWATLFYKVDNKVIRKLLKRVLRRYPELIEIQKNSLLLFLGRISNVGEIKLSGVTIKDYLELLEAGVEFVKEEWFTTYKLPVEDWLSFGEYATTYHAALKKRKNIEKIRCVIRPIAEIPSYSSLQKTNLVIDTINADARINFYSHEKIQDINYLKKIPDFALYDDVLVITGEIQIPQNHTRKLTLDDKVNIRILYGIKTNQFVGWSKRLLEQTPDQNF